MGYRIDPVADTDNWDALTHCECGQPLDSHDPLPEPKPFVSWKAQRTRDEVQLEKMTKAKNKNVAWTKAWKIPGKGAEDD